MQTASKYIFDSYDLDRDISTARFAYAVELENGRRESFVEKLRFPAGREAWDGLPPDLLQACLRSLHLVLGLSYWKMHCAPEIAISGYGLGEAQAVFWETLYTKGLGEFFFRNKIDFRGLVKFPRTGQALGVAPLPRQSRCLVPLGGGKDSLVTAELLKEKEFKFQTFTLGTSIVQQQVARVMRQEPLVVERKLDPRMLELSASGEVFNGHIPVSAIYHFAGVLLAALADYGYVVFSNERSAEQGNVEYLGQTVNHQWSKTEEFETLARGYVGNFITPDIVPFSLLRPLSEIEIVRRFAQYPKYFQTFSSCNRNFVVATTQPAAERGAYWCGRCPKCAFVFALLAAFLDKDQVVDIFGQDLFADASLLPLFKALLGRGEFKPFECVGTPEEMLVAMNRAAQTGRYDGDVVMDYFVGDVVPLISDFGDMEKRVLGLGDTVSLPQPFRHIYEG